ncbi:MAG TPA: LytTR family DNA-binding domain-containing protein [Puia sp.]|nr:LytTR family DNA-binding domain-containing protein [Puia sp.]
MIPLDCIVVDDEPDAGKLLEDYIGRLPHLKLRAVCFDAPEVIAFLQHSKADLLFLDINMPGLSGMELARVLPKKQKIIFTTAYSEYAIESFEHNVIDYLLKPISFARFSAAIAKAGELINSQAPVVASEPTSWQSDEYLFVKADKKMIRLNFSDILYFEALKEYVCVCTKTQKILVYKRMKELTEKLPLYFKRVHNSFIINCRHIAKMEGNLVVIDNKEIPIGISYKEEFMRFIEINAL